VPDIGGIRALVLLRWPARDDRHKPGRFAKVALEFSHTPNVGLLVGLQRDLLVNEVLEEVAVDRDVTVAVAEVDLHGAPSRVAYELCLTHPTGSHGPS
jgi:hypothetical protein